MKKKQDIILSIIILSFIFSIFSNGIIQNYPSTQIKNSDDGLITEISAPATSGYTITQKWKWKEPWAANPDPRQVEISLDGNYIVGIWSGNPNATLFKKGSNSTIWIYTSPQFLGPRPFLDVAISADGKYIVVSDDEQVYFLNNSAADPKTEMWRFPNTPTTADYYVDISFLGDYISVSNGSHLFLLNKTGDVLWTYDTQSTISAGAVAISGDGNYI